MSRLVANPARSPALARALLLREPAGGGAPGGVQNVPIGPPPPATVASTEIAAGPSPPPNTVTYTGAGSRRRRRRRPLPRPRACRAALRPARPRRPVTDPATTPATTTNTAPPTDTSTPHLDPTLTVDPFNVTVTLTVADLHAWRSSRRLVDVDFLADPSVAISVGTDPAHAVAGQAAVNLMLVHVKQNGEAVLDLGFGPSVGVGAGGASRWRSGDRRVSRHRQGLDHLHRHGDADAERLRRPRRQLERRRRSHFPRPAARDPGSSRPFRTARSLDRCQCL